MGIALGIGAFLLNNRIGSSGTIGARAVVAMCSVCSSVMMACTTCRCLLLKLAHWKIGAQQVREAMDFLYSNFELGDVSFCQEFAPDIIEQLIERGVNLDTSLDLNRQLGEHLKETLRLSGPSNCFHSFSCKPL